ncbi:MAG TPA: amidoligase family protein [Azospirillum sp.]
MIRRVGVEVEFQGISVQSAAQALAAAFGGTCWEEDRHAFHILGTSIGRLSVELDIRYAHPQRTATTPRVRLGPTGAAWLGTVLGRIVPRELITAPLPIDTLDRVDRAVGVLRAAGARGSGATLFGSLGLHFNVDPPSLDAETLTAVLKAFLLLNRRLRHETTGGAATAAFLPAPYPDAYVRRVVAPDYWPDRATLAADYLAANPTRNRDLDLLPLLLHIDPVRVRARLPYEKIGNGAVFHYRLPRAYVGDPAWSIASAWNGWVAVEELAGDRDRLDELGRDHCRDAPAPCGRAAPPRIRA